MFDRKILELQYHFGIEKPEDWQKVKPEWILGRKNFGPSILNHIRMYLAARGLTLDGDETPEYWRSNLSSSRIAKTMGFGDTTITAPFSILVDSQEQYPFGFDNIPIDKSNWPTDIKHMVNDGQVDPADVRYFIPIEFKSLGPTKGDYSIKGGEGSVHVERKSLDDVQSTLLGWNDRRRRFENELAFLSGLEFSGVVIECTRLDMLDQAKAFGKKPVNEIRKILFRQSVAWQNDFRVPWYFCDNRRMAELVTFRILFRYFEKRMK